MPRVSEEDISPQIREYRQNHWDVLGPSGDLGARTRMPGGHAGPAMHRAASSGVFGQTADRSRGRTGLLRVSGMRWT